MWLKNLHFGKCRKGRQGIYCENVLRDGDGWNGNLSAATDSFERLARVLRLSGWLVEGRLGGLQEATVNVRGGQGGVLVL